MTRLGSVSHTLKGIVIALAMLAPVASMTATAAPKDSKPSAPSSFTFAVIGNVPERADEEGPVRTLLDAIDAGAFLDGRRASPETIRVLKAYDASRMPVVKPA